jgi:4-alpha-glucanotransferase
MTALPAGRGAGAFGKSAYDFVDFLVAAGQSLWQILPVGPVGKSLSPYQSGSAFAGNPDFIDRAAVCRDPERYAPKGAVFAKFIRENAAWLEGYALFEAVRRTRRGLPLSGWPDEIRNPPLRARAALLESCSGEILRIRHEQFCFFRQWRELKRYANLKGVGIIGDLPIYVCEDSADFWLRRSAFDVAEDGRPASSAGVPPDGFSKSGQIWNNPVYVWNKSGGQACSFWRERLTQAARLYDGVRIDHFRAFADYYAFPAGGGKGAWRPGPGKPFTDRIRREFPGLSIIAEDLGELSEAAKQLVADSGFPGMKVLQFAFSGGADNPHLPHNIQKNAVVYTGTHDNNTLLGWRRAAPRRELSFAMKYFGLRTGEDLPAALLAAALASNADTAIIPLQDWLGLGASARLNKPATVGGRNWKWRLPEGALTRSLAARIRYQTQELYGR